jgi:cytochrome b
MQRGRASASGGRTLVWALPVRLLHWLLAGLVFFELVQDDGGRLHRGIGYVAVGVVVARLLHAALTGGTSSLAATRPSLSSTRRYLRDGAPRTLGHDPLGAWMVWLLWSLVLLLGLTGWMSRLDAFWGDERVHDLHVWLADALIAAVGLHLAGVAAMSWRWRENLVAAMFSGRKRGAKPD